MKIWDSVYIFKNIKLVINHKNFIDNSHYFFDFLKCSWPKTSRILQQGKFCFDGEKETGLHQVGEGKSVKGFKNTVRMVVGSHPPSLPAKSIFSPPPPTEKLCIFIVSGFKEPFFATASWPDVWKNFRNLKKLVELFENLAGIPWIIGLCCRMDWLLVWHSGYCHILCLFYPKFFILPLFN